LSDKDFEDVFELDILKDIHGQTVESTDEDLELEYLNLQNLNSGYEADDFDDEDSDIMEELKNIEEAVQKPAIVEDTEMVSERDFEDNNMSNQKESGSEDNEAKDILENPKSNSQDSSAADSEDSNGLETLWEHQDLIEQLKMELKKVRATGLPTILEEDESPKIMEDLKPWKIDEKFQHEDRMSELHKFYKSYRERMRKLDILSYQKVYAMSKSLITNPVFFFFFSFCRCIFLFLLTLFVIDKFSIHINLLIKLFLSIEINSTTYLSSPFEVRDKDPLNLVSLVKQDHEPARITSI
jgi:hypothetical protein